MAVAGYLGGFPQETADTQLLQSYPRLRNIGLLGTG